MVNSGADQRVCEYNQSFCHMSLLLEHVSSYRLLQRSEGVVDFSDSCSQVKLALAAQYGSRHD
jgi:hypothetical protein